MATRATPVADLWSGLWAAILAACGLFALVDAFAPAQDLPWKPLDLRQPIGAATAAKLAALEVSDADTAQRADQLTAQCLTLLRQAGVTASRVPDQDDGGFCVVRGAIRISSGEQTPLNPAGVVMRCPMAARLILWDREIVPPGLWLARCGRAAQPACARQRPGRQRGKAFGWPPGVGGGGLGRFGADGA
nr:extensin family protein [Brevundimonas naejangsanensis]